MVVSGCVAGPDGPSPTDPHAFTTTTSRSDTGSTLTIEGGLNAFRDCLREQGVGIEPIGLDALGRPRLAEALDDFDLTDRVVLDALELCGHHLSSGPLDLSPDPELRELVQDSLHKLADCLRSWGVRDFPDPIPGYDGVGAPFPSSQIPWSDPDLPGAVRRCRGATT
jgi:hypothetical protein